MRKPRRLTQEQLAPWVWEMASEHRSPELRGQKTEDRKAEDVLPSLSSELCPLSSGEAPRSLIDWHALFGNTNPVEIEVGMGKGLFLLNSALARPETNFFGIEIVRKYQLYAATRFAIRKLPNVKTACADAKLLLRDFVAPGSVAAVHVYFPDPWWKNRHRKRRVFTEEFAADVSRVLMTGGRLLIASDVEEYFGVMTAIVNALPVFAHRPDETDLAAPHTAVGFATNFERKALATGGSVWRAVYERK